VVVLGGDREELIGWENWKMRGRVWGVSKVGNSRVDGYT
jgi:hypothetical protein